MPATFLACSSIAERSLDKRVTGERYPAGQPFSMLFIGMDNIETIKKFLAELETYQSNHFGYYDRDQMVNAYQSLPTDIKTFLAPKKNLLQMLWRGCDGLSEVRAISFTTSASNASIFGAYVIPFKELINYDGLIDTEKARMLSEKIKSGSDIGDDEGEVIVIHPIWNPQLNLKSYFVE